MKASILWSAAACHRFGRAEQAVCRQRSDFEGYGPWPIQSGSKLPHSRERRDRPTTVAFVVRAAPEMVSFAQPP